MATRTALLNGNVINRDCDFSKYIESVSEPGVIEGLTVTASSVAVGKCWVPCERANGDIIYALVYNSSAQSISGDGDVYVKVSQEIIDNGELGNEDGTGIATIEVGTMPAKNALKLATITSGVVEDKRNMIKKVGELLEMINENISDISDLDTRVENLEEAEAIDHLEETGYVGELYTLSNLIFKQSTPTLANSDTDCKVGDENANKQIHIQRIASGNASNQLKLKVKKVGSPTTSLIVEVRKGSQVNVSSSEAYWYGGGALVCSGSIAYSNISGTYAEKTITLDGNYGGTKGELLDIVVYQTDNMVDASNYYCIACDSTQYSEGFSYVAVNGNTRTRSKLMPYCIGNGLLDGLMCKTGDDITIQSGVSIWNQTTVRTGYDYHEMFTAPRKGKYYISSYRTEQTGSNPSPYITIYRNRTAIYTNNTSGTVSEEVLLDQGDVIEYTNINGYFSVTITADYYAGKGAKSNDNPCKPREVKGLGVKIGGTLFGEHIDGTMFTGKETTSVITGGITPGNFVGFLKIGDYKIPYYK